MAVDRRRDLLRERQRDAARDFRRQVRQTPDERREKNVRVRQARRRVTRHRKDRLAFHNREAGRLSGLHRYPMEQHVAFRREHIDHQVALANRAAAGKHHDIVRKTVLERAGQRFECVRRRRKRDGDSTVVRHDGRQREPVDVVNLSRLQRPARLDDFVARRENRHTRALE